MKTKSDIRRTLRRNRTFRRGGALPAVLGDGQGNLFDTESGAGYLFITVMGVVGSAYNARIFAPRYGDNVWVGYDTSFESEVYQILSHRGSGAGSLSYIYNSANFSWGGSDPVWIYLRQFMPLRPSVTNADMILHVFRGFILSSSGKPQRVDAQTVDLTSYIPLTADTAALVLVTINTSGALVVTDGADVTPLTDLVTSAVYSNLPAIPASTAFIVCAVRVFRDVNNIPMTVLYEPMTVSASNEAIRNDLVDLRWMNATLGAASGDLGGSYPSPTVVQASGAFAFVGDISPTQITSNQDNYNPTGLSGASTLRLSTDASRNITGLSGGADGRILILTNVGSFNIVLKDESSSSTAANRFALYADKTVAPDTSVILQYDSTSSRWRIADAMFYGDAAGGDLASIYPDPVVARASTTFALTGDISPSSYSANQHNLDPTGLSSASTIRIDCTTSITISGLAGGADGRIIVIQNISANTVTLLDENAGSTAGNRFKLSADLSLAPYDGAILQYDATVSRWRCIGHTVSGAGGSGHTIQEEGTPLTARANLDFQGAGVTATDDSGNDATVITIPGGSGLTNNNIAPTTSDVTGVVNNRYFIDLSGLTASRNFKLPAGGVGDIIELYVVVGDPTYELIIKGDTGITVNLGASATEWSRIFITGEVVKAVMDTTTNWMIAYDGRIPCKGLMTLSAAETTNSAATATTPTWDNKVIDVGEICDTSNYRFNIRRAGIYNASGSYFPNTAPSDQNYLEIDLYLNTTEIAVAVLRASGATTNTVVSSMRGVSCVVGDYINYKYWSQQSNRGIYNGAAHSWFQVEEVIR